MRPSTPSGGWRRATADRASARCAALAGAALAAGILLAAAVPARAARAPFDPAGTVLQGTEKHAEIGRAPVTFHLGADGTAAAAVVDPSATAFGWTGTWTTDGTTLTLTLPAPGPGVDALAVSLRLNAAGAGKGTMEREGGVGGVSALKVKASFPARKAKGWTAVVPRLRTGTGTAAGTFRSTVTIRRVDTPVKKKALRPMALSVRPLTAGGLPGLPIPVLLPPGATVRLSGPSLPPLPQGVTTDAIQLEITGGKEFTPGAIAVVAVEEALRGVDPAANGAAAPVHWVRALKKKEAAGLPAETLAAPHFLDDGGAGATPRETHLVLRDLAPLAGLAPTGTVRVHVLAPGGAALGAVDVALAPRTAATVRLLDVPASPGDLPGGEGQVRITAADGAPLRRGAVAAVLAGTVRSGGVPVTSTMAAAGAPASLVPASSVSLVLPYMYLPDDEGASSARVVVANTGTAARSLPVAVRGLDGTALHQSDVAVAAGEAVRFDPDALGVDRGDLPDGECQIVIGPVTGAVASDLVARAEVRLAGEPGTVFGSALRLEVAGGPPGAAPVIHAPDVEEALGASAGSRDALFAIRNAGNSFRGVTARAFLADGTPLVTGSHTLAVAPGGVARVTAETLFALLGAPVEPLPAVRRVALVLEPDATDGAPWSVVAIHLRYSANAVGGHDLPLDAR